jgi:DNA primase
MDDAEEWLCSRFGEEIEGLEDVIDPELFDIGKKEHKKQNKELDPSILEAYNQFHPYMKTRKLTDEVIKKFQIGYNPTLNTITFPVYDERHRLVMITQRGIATKKFYIDTGAEKPVYLLYDLIENNKDTAFITESQINALTLRGYGYDAVALFGTGSDEQYDILMKSGIKKFILCFDGDYAGRSGARKFKRRFSDGKHLIIDIVMPDGKDVNDITKEEFDELFEKSLEKI